MQLFLSCFLAFFVTLGAIFVMKPWAIHIGLVGSPNDRKRHDGQIPLIGGIAMLFGLAIGWLTLHISFSSYRVFLAAIAVIVFFAVLDDFHELTHKARFVVQFFVAFMIAHVGKHIIYNLGNFLFIGNVHLGFLGLPFTILAIVGVINSINMIDGMDGLAGTIALIQLVFLSFIAWHIDYYGAFSLIVVIIGPLLAFLIFNFPFKFRRSKIFMGDVGSALLGILLSWFLISLSQSHTGFANPVMFLWIMAVPLFDLANVIYRRLRKGVSPFKGDREHLHHVLQEVGCKPFCCVMLISLWQITFGIAGITLNYLHVSEGVMFVILFICFLCYVFFVNHAQGFMICLKKIFGKDQPVYISESK